MARKRKLILTIDDDQSVRSTIRLALEMAGFEVIEACDGEEALRVLHESSDLPAVILCDWQMPTMDGEEFLAAKKCDPVLSEIPVVIVSGSAGKAALSAGATRVLNKPFTLDALFEVVALEEVRHPPKETMAACQPQLAAAGAGG